METCSGNILLLGEGDFSFSVAFAKKLSEKPNSQIVSTSLLTSEELNRIHKSAATNIDQITHLGVQVFHGIDATTLEAYPQFLGQDFDFIIFNFPHTGGKSNIKNNRKLLKNLFPSVGKKIKGDGKILISLARGQGGTPIDEPARTWHDSWQVIGMAAYADLVLRKVEPFNIDFWSDYSSTGFKSLDRHFYTGGALTYCFVKTEPFTVPACEGNIEELVPCSVNGQMVNTNQYVAQKFNRNLLKNSDHPLSCITKQLQISLADNFKENSFINLGFLEDKIVKFENVKRVSSEIKTDIQSDVTNKYEPTIEIIKNQRHLNINPHYSIKYDISNGCENPNTEVKSKYCLRSSLLDCDKVFESKENSIYTGYGDVYRRVWADNEHLPVAHELILLSCDINLDNLKQNVLRTIENILPGSTVMVSNVTDDSFYDHYFDRDSVWCVEVGYKSNNQSHCLSCNQVGAKGPATQIREKNKQIKLSKFVAFGGKLKSNLAEKGMELASGKSRATTNNSLHAVILNLDSVTQIKYDIPDIRILWTADEEFLQQFNSNNISNSPDIFIPLSYYPPLWRHDVSFWEREDEIFNEEKFLDLIRNITGDALECVILMNVWKNPDTGRLSKCYRLIYQSHDRALSHEKAHDFQNAVRICVEKIMCVELR